jgi:hypothetical protein
MRPSVTSTTASRTGGPPVPSMSVAPEIARVAGADCNERPAAAAGIRQTTARRIRRMCMFVSTRKFKVQEFKVRGSRFEVLGRGSKF